jgi:6-phosphogluconolactonase (cycloisomerase 2 family)
VVIDNNLQLSATGTYTDSSTQPITATATWTSSSTTVAAISSAAGSSGLATGEAKGTTMITAASGSITSPPITLTVIIEYVYATSFNGNGVSQYTVGPGGGLVPMTPASVGPPYVFGASLIAVDPTQHFVYVVNYTTPGSVSEYSIGATGALTFLNSMTTGTGSSSDGIAIDPSGPYLYVPNFYVPGGAADSTVSQFVIQPDGTLAANTAGAEVAAGSGPSSVAVNAAGTVVYVPNALDDTVSVYSIGTGVGVGGGTAGALTQTGTASLAAGSSSSDYLAIDPTGAYAYVSSQSGSTIQLFDISAADGSLTAAMGLPLSLPAGSEPTELTLGGAAGNYLYAPAYGLSELYQLSIGAGGALTLLNTTIMPNGTYPSFIAVDASGQFAYVSNRGAVGSGTYGTTISQYSIGTGGLLTPLSTPTAPSGTQPVGIATAIQY